MVLPEKIGEYRLLSVLGEGGMGTVYEAVGAGGQVVAVKLLKDVDGIHHERFEREASLSIEHPNIVRIKESAISEHGPYIVMERLYGMTLADKLFEQGALSIEETLNVATACGQGLMELHKRAIVHRDIKPANIFLCDNDTVKLMDFGIAAHLDATKLTVSGQVLGTPSYVSPEQVEGKERIDGRSDLFSLGVVLYECLSGENPFRKDTAFSTLVATLLTQPEPIQTQRKDTPNELAHALHGLLQKDREQRTSQASLMLEGLREENAVPLIAQNEARNVVILGCEVKDAPPSEVTSVLQNLGADVVKVPGSTQVIGIWGGRTSEGNELERAVAAAKSLTAISEKITIAPGRIEHNGTRIEGEPIEAIEAALASEFLGVSVTERTLSALPSSVRTHKVTKTLWRIETGPELAQERRPLFGRDALIDQLSDRIHRSLDEQCACLAWVIGVAGIGKSALVAQALLTESLRDFPCIDVAHRRGVSSLGLFHQFFPKLRLDLEASRSALSMGEAHDSLTRGILDSIDAQIAGGLILCFEDVHQADQDSLDLLIRLHEEFSDRPLAIVACARDELEDRASHLMSAPGTSRHYVDGLSRKDSIALCNSHKSLTEERQHRVIALAGGNPFFVEQLSLADDLPDAALPFAIESVLQSRYDSLPDSEKTLCKRLAVLNRPASLSELTVLCDDFASRSVRKLRSKRILRRLSGERVHFAGPMLQPVAYGMLSSAAKLQAHLDVATKVACSASERANHYELAQENDLAIEQYLVAAKVAHARGDAPGVMLSTDRALSLGFGDSATLRLWRVDALRFSGKREASLAEIERAVELSQSDADFAWSLSERAIHRLRLGSLEGAFSDATESRRRALKQEDSTITTLASGRFAQVLIARGELDEADRILSLCDVSPSRKDLLAFVEEWKGQSAAAKGDTDARRRHFQKATLLHEGNDNLRRAAGASANLADVLNRVGRYKEATMALEKALLLCKQSRHTVMEGYVQLNIGFAMGSQGLALEATESLDAAAHIASESNDVHLASLVALYRARLHYHHDRFAEALIVAGVAAEHASHPGVKLQAKVFSICAEQSLGQPLSTEPHALANALLELPTLEEEEVETCALLSRLLAEVGESDAASHVCTRGENALRILRASTNDDETRHSVDSMRSTKLMRRAMTLVAS